MKKILLTVAVLFYFLLPTAASANEFQPLGALGIGAAGVARTTDAYASYWNPAGLAFYEKPFSAKLNAGVGININSSLADNMNKLGKMDVNDMKNLSFSNTALDIPANLSASAQAVEFVGVVNDLDRNEGTLTVTPVGGLAFQYRNFGVGAMVTSELGSFPVSDTVNVRLGDPAISTLSNFAEGIGATLGTPQRTLFNTTQRAQIEAAFFNNGANGVSAAQATAIVNKLEGQLLAGNKSGQTSQQLADTMINVAQSFSSNQGSIENNLSSIELRGIILIDIPIAYGHKFDLGPFGTIGLGGAFKVIQGTVFARSQQLVNINSSSDIIKRMTDLKAESTNFGVDLGALWRYADMLNVGIVVKNLNSPEFDSPTFTTVQGTQFSKKFRVDPQVRMGAALDPLSWLTVAADCDLTKNSTVLASRKSRNIGGGFDLHPLSWFAVRAGMYANLAETTTGPVGTFGISLGPKWLRLDLDAASAFETGRNKDSTYPRDARVEFAMSTTF